MKSNLQSTVAIGLLVVLLAGLTVFLNFASKPSDNGEINKSFEITSPANTSPPQQTDAATVDYSEIRDSIRRIDKKIDRLDLSIAKLDQNLELIKNQREEKLRKTKAPPINPPLPPVGLGGDRKSMEKPTDWLSGLDSSTRVRVDDVFKQNKLRMREAMQSMGPVENVDRETMQEMFESNQKILKNELKEVLSPEDYERFINSLPPPPAPPDLTALPKNKQ